MKTRIGLLILAVVAAIAVGCGNEEQNDYVDEVNQLQTQLVEEVNAVVTGDPPTTPEGAGEVAGELAQVFSDGADEFEAVEPPEEVADLHAQLVEAIRGIADQVSAAEEAFNSGNAQEASQAALALQQAGTDIQVELDQLIGDINNELQN